MRCFGNKCKTEDCNQKYVAHGYCNKCYQRIKYNKTKVLSTRESKAPLTVEQLQEIKKRSSRFQTSREIAEAMGLSSAVVARSLKKAKLKESNA